MMQRVAVLEQRLSMAGGVGHQEPLLDSVVKMGPCASTSIADLDSTIEVIPSASEQDMDALKDCSASASTPVSPLSLRHPTPESEDLWLALGAKPKQALKRPAAALAFTPNPLMHADNWCSVGTWSMAKKRCKSSHSQSPKHDLELSNRFDVLNVEDFPPLPALRPSPRTSPVDVIGNPPVAGSESESGTSARRQKLKARRNIANEAAFKPELSTDLAPSTLRNPQATIANMAIDAGPTQDGKQKLNPTLSTTRIATRIAPSTSTTSPSPLFAPTAAIVGDSIIRNVRFFNAKTCCFPGATVKSITDKLPGLLCSFPNSISSIIIHIGANEVNRDKFQLVKNDFIELFDILKSCEKTVFISGVLPTLGHGPKRFARLSKLHDWLQDTAATYGFNFIDNFNLFWDRSSFYRNDGLHPNRQGTSFLVANIRYAVRRRRSK